MTADEEDEDGTSNASMAGEGFTRFKLLFRAFLRCVTSRESPIILFLDDIQWADEASLEVVKALVTDNLPKHTMIIGSYREGEMHDTVLREYNLLNEASGSDSGNASALHSSPMAHRAHVTDIAVSELGVESLNGLVSAVLEMDRSDTVSLSAPVLNKTDGNPFYVLSFLDMLESEALLLKGEDRVWT
jgi:predicted ATPase